MVAKRDLRKYMHNKIIKKTIASLSQSGSSVLCPLETNSSIWLCFACLQHICCQIDVFFFFKFASVLSICIARRVLLPPYVICDFGFYKENWGPILMKLWNISQISIQMQCKFTKCLLGRRGIVLATIPRVTTGQTWKQGWALLLHPGSTWYIHGFHPLLLRIRSWFIKISSRWR